MCRTRRQGRIAAAIAASLFLASTQLCAVEAQAASAVNFYIESQPLVKALNEWALQAGLQVVWPAGNADAYSISTPVQGTLEPMEALSVLLKGTGLTFSVVSEGRTVAIRDREQTVRLRGTSTKTEMSAGSPSFLRIAATAEEPLSGSTASTHQGNDAQLQTAELKEDGDALIEIIVTGTHIRGATASSAAVRKYTRDDIEKSGVATVAQFVNKLPQNFSADSGDTTFFGNSNNDAEAGTAINLRGLGTAGTLVLLNGRRLAPGAMGEFVDISSIPLSAIERVDVLTDGASAIYGSDAIAGVVNFILRKEFEGAETHVRVGDIAGSSAAETSASQAFGATWETGNLLVTGSYDKQDEILASDRSYAAVPSPFYLSPRNEGAAALVSINQRVTDTIRTSFDGSYSSRNVTDAKTLDFLPTYRYRTDVAQYSLGAGLVADLAGRWATELYLNDGENKRDSTFDFLGEVNPSFYQGRVSSIDLKADGPIYTLPGGDLSLAIGASIRRERYRSGDVAVQALGFPEGRFKREVKAAFGEVSVPIVGTENARKGMRSLSLSLAGRYESYTDAGDSFDPKVALLWEVSPELSFRTSLSSSFNTARYVDTITAFNLFAIRTMESSACEDGECLVLIEQGAKTNYEPETSRSFSLGLGYEPSWAQGLKISLSYYNIRYEDRLGLPPPSAVVLARSSSFPSLVVADPSAAFVADFIVRGSGFINFINEVGAFDPDGVDYYLDLRTTNLALTKTNGIDLDLRYAIEGANTRWDFGLEATYVIELSNKVTPISELTETIDTITNPLSTRARGSVTYSRDAFSVGAFVNYSGSYQNNNFMPQQSIDSWTTLDIRASVPIDNWLGVFDRGSAISVSFQNVTNSDPPYALNPIFPIGFDPTNSDPNGRTISLDVLARW